jgi:peptidoglycan-associated lipoprotein
MNRIIMKSGGMVFVGFFLLFSQGCGLKWLQSGGESESGVAASGSADSTAQHPSLHGEGGSSELSGFSHNPSEERVTAAQGGVPTSLSPSEVGHRRRAELTKEEKAAREAGLQDVFFGYDQWMVSHAGMESLNRDAMYLKEHPAAVLKVEGHCDERGTSDYNMVLGDKRAKAAQRYLIESGVSAKQVVIVSFGKERPFCFDPEEGCYQQNRRGHMLLSTKQ